MMFLVTGTSHCGTRSFRAALEKLGVVCTDKGTGGPFPQGLRERHWGDPLPYILDDWLRDTFFPGLKPPGAVWHNAAWVAHEFLDHFGDEARIVWLVRRAVPCVGGLLKHGGGAGFLNYHASWILTPEHFGKASLTEAERHAWLWSHLNTIGVLLAERHPSRVRIAKLEDNESIIEAMRFLGVERPIRIPLPHITSPEPCPVPLPEIKQACERFCVELEDKIYA